VTIRIFLSYRHRGDAAVRRQIFDRLRKHVGVESLVWDDGFTDGVDLDAQVVDAIGRCTALLALIDPDWIEAMPRLREPGDYVRMEIAHALRTRMPVIPVLIGAAMPGAEALPPEIADFAKYRGRAIEVNRGFPDAVRRLVESVRRIHEGEEWATGVYRNVNAHVRDGRWKEARALLETAFDEERTPDGGWRKFNRGFPVLRELYGALTALETASVAFEAGCFEHVNFVLEDAAKRDDAAARATIVARIGVAAATALHHGDRDALEAQQMRLESVGRAAGARNVVPGAREVAAFIAEAKTNLANRAALELRADALYKAAVNRYDYVRDDVTVISSADMWRALAGGSDKRLVYSMRSAGWSDLSAFSAPRLPPLVDFHERVDQRRLLRTATSFPAADLSELAFTIAAPSVVKRGEANPVTVWAHAAASRRPDIEAMPDGGAASLLTVRLHSRDLHFDDERPMLWQGSAVRAGFEVLPCSRGAWAPPRGGRGLRGRTARRHASFFPSGRSRERRGASRRSGGSALPHGLRLLR
jgi:hypothetical protein